MSRQIVFVWGLATIIALSGCSDDSSPATGADLGTADTRRDVTVPDQGPTCPSGLVFCDGRCVDPLVDRSYCGATSDCSGANAGETCTAGQVCSAGSCALSCQSGLIDCDGRCVDPLVNNTFCGATEGCGKDGKGNAGATCAMGQVCSAGTCALTCQTGLIDCAGKCIDPLVDNAFCGATDGCGKAGTGSPGATCAAGQVCSAGSCALTCQSGLIDCGGKCIDPLVDNAFCGATLGCGAGGTGSAGAICAAGQVCSAGTCSLSCQAGLLDCGGKCIDPLVDNTFCGASADCAGANVGATCASGQVCSGGSCALTCQSGLIDCGGKCIDPLVDNTFCGATVGCGVGGVGSAGLTCTTGQVCSAGTCALTCQSGLIDCSGKCIDPLVDNTFCGATPGCGTGGTGSSGSPGIACAAGQVCSGGSCALTCQSGLIDCGGKCIDPLVDNTFCGASSDCAGNNAGATCPTGQVCSAGSCALTCQSGLIACGGKCVDPLVDNTFCGATAGCGDGGAGSAGLTCGAGQVCSGGTCALTCQSGLIDCGGRCVDPLVDNTYCGATAGCGASGSGSAGATCPAGQVCSGGSCALTCQSGLIDCGGTCIDPLVNNTFCGATAGCGAGGHGSAGATCPAGQVCSAGSCALTCQSGLMDCGGTCIDPLVDNTYCGATAGCGAGGSGSAGATCPAGQVCNAGSCALTCQNGLIDCGGTCVDPLVNNTFCGATAGCGVGGSGSAGSTCLAGQVCSAGSCGLTCQSGLIDCSGKCVDPLVDNGFCGATAGCGVGGVGSAGATCAPGTTCNGGACTLSCQAGLSKCGAAGSEECVNLLTDNRYCSDSGACGSACPAGTSCTNGVCAPTCGPGLTVCGSTCVDTGRDPNHCGGCGNKCPSGQFCPAGACTVVCPSNFLNCNNSCVDHLTNASHCGACGNACPANHACEGGVCKIQMPAQCTLYTTINDGTRNVGAGAGTACDRSISVRWYRFEGASGTQMPTVAPPTNRCGTHSPGWLNGTHPANPADTVVRQACFNWTGGTCRWSTNIQVTNCDGFFVYYLTRPAFCNLRYCAQ